jgi:hypothetical protein
MSKKPATKIEPTEISDTLVAAYADDLLELDQQIDDLQQSKKRVYEAIRDDHGKKAAKALKIAVTIHAMDSGKRQQAEEIDTEAQRMLAIIAAPRAPRATRTREIIEQIDAETGEIIEHGSRAKAAHVASRGEDAGERQQSSNPGIAGADEPGRQTSASADADPAPNSEPANASPEADAADSLGVRNNVAEPPRANTPVPDAEANQSTAARMERATPARHGIEMPGESASVSAPTVDASQATAGTQAPPVDTHRVMSMTPLEPRTAGGLKGFGFTVKFDDVHVPARPVEAGGVRIPQKGVVLS